MTDHAPAQQFDTDAPLEPIRIPQGRHDGVAAVPAAEAAAAAPAPTVEQVAEATDGSLAARLRAKHAEIQQGTKEFDVPGWDGDLVLVAKVVRNRKQLAAGMKNEQLILEATQKVLFRNDDTGQLEDIGGWAGVARAMGHEQGVTLGQVIATVLDNPLRLDGFAEQIIAWMMGRRSAIEQVLGE